MALGVHPSEMPNTHDPIDALVLERYVAGEATPAERVAVERWAAVDRANGERLAEMRLFWAGASEAPAVDTERALTRLKRRVRLQVVSSDRRAGATSHWAPRRVVPLVGATIAAGILVLLVARADSIDENASHGRQYVAAPGRRENVTLPDGTHFILAPASRLRLAADFANGARDVYLDGEAFFAVRHDPAHPFAVHARGAIAQDIGTQFDVRAYAADAATQVVVADGEVAIDTVAIRAGDMAMIKRGRISIVHGADVGALTGWTRGELSFHDTPLRVVAADLSRWYGVEIVIADPQLARIPVTATIGEESLTHALDLLAPTVGARYVMRGSAVTIHAAIHINSPAQ